MHLTNGFAEKNTLEGLHLLNLGCLTPGAASDKLMHPGTASPGHVEYGFRFYTG